MHRSPRPALTDHHQAIPFKVFPCCVLGASPRAWNLQVPRRSLGAKWESGCMGGAGGILISGHRRVSA